MLGPLARRRLNIPSVGAAIIVIGAAAAEAPGQFSSDKVALRSRVTLAQFNASNGNDCWGYVSPSGREYALMGLNDKLTVVEITDPDNPAIIGSVSHSNSFTGDVKVYQDYAYVVNDAGGGIDVIDLTNVDNGQVTLVQRVTDGGMSHSHNIALNTDSGFLYLGVGNINGGSLVAWDLSDPADPVIAGSYGGDRSHDLHVVSYTEGKYAGREIAFSFSEGRGLDIIDVTDKSNMFLIDRIMYPNTAYCHQGWVSDDKQYVYLNDELDGIPRTTVIDVSDLENPFFVNDFTSSSGSIDHNLYIRDGFVFEANYTSGLRIFDANQDPANPPLVGFFDTYPENNSPNFTGAWSNYPYFPSGMVIVSDVARGLFVLDPSEAVGGGACAADITAAEVTFGSNQGAQDPTRLEADDNDRTTTSSDVFLSALEPNLGVLEVGANFGCLGPGSMMTIDIQDQASQPNVVSRVRLVPAGGGTPVQVGQYAVSFNADSDHQMEVAEPGKFIEGNGDLVVEIRYSTVALLSPLGFDGRTDRVALVVQ